ncbi:MAG: GerMN domain-containing protein [Dehalococcoidia bacterium]
MFRYLASCLALVSMVLLVACEEDPNATPTPTATSTASGLSIYLSLFYPRVTTDDFELVEVERVIPDTPRVGTAALELLIEGPTPAEESQLGIFDPIPDGTRLLSLNIVDRVATADFSAEILNYGGGSLNVRAITGMIEATLKQFPTVDSVVLLVEGQPDQIQP